MNTTLRPTDGHVPFATLEDCPHPRGQTAPRAGRP
jgi:hypothetical protein